MASEIEPIRVPIATLLAYEGGFHLRQGLAEQEEGGELYEHGDGDPDEKAEIVGQMQDAGGDSDREADQGAAEGEGGGHAALADQPDFGERGEAQIGQHENADERKAREEVHQVTLDQLDSHDGLRCRKGVSSIMPVG